MLMRLLKAIACTACLASLVACEVPDTPDVNSHTSRSIRIWSDPQTGCEYVIFDSHKRAGMTHRLNSDGTPMCPESEATP